MTTSTTWLEDIANASSTNEDDGKRIQTLLRKIGMPSAKVVLGVVYMDGHGTIENPPVSVQAMARSLAEIFKNNLIKNG